KDGSQSLLKVSLTDEGKNIRIRIKDNGPGIPKGVIDKLFEPFYTTKPTGSGTGLGLSLCYDIVVKAHSGQLTVNSDPGEGAEFNIVLPKKNGSA
ncbi:MAG: HAMP domain-containing histidine kinase, partial [Bacteroidia bacterium]|nr:HAMP domain-containing histidine kinase [Bacteroidia bacterium]